MGNRRRSPTLQLLGQGIPPRPVRCFTPSGNHAATTQLVECVSTCLVDQGRRQFTSVMISAVRQLSRGRDIVPTHALELLVTGVPTAEELDQLANQL